MLRVGFEPTPPKRTELESAALDPSAIEAPFMGSNAGVFFFIIFIIFFLQKKKKYEYNITQKKK